MYTRPLLITKEEGQSIILKLKTDPYYWHKFVKLPQAKRIFGAKMVSCCIRKEYYDDMVMEMFIHLYRNDWAELDKIEYPEKFWGWFSMKVRTYFGFYKDKVTGEYHPKRPLRELLDGGTMYSIDDINATYGEDRMPKYQPKSSDNSDDELLGNEYMEQFSQVLNEMRFCGRKSFPVYVEVLERIWLYDEDRTSIAVDLVKRGLVKGPLKREGDTYSEEELIKLRDNLNNNIYRRARDFFIEVALRRNFEFNFAQKPRT